MSGAAPPSTDQSPRDLVVIGASAGGVGALKQLVEGLPADLPAAICVVLHIAPTGPSALASILGRAGRLPCRTAADGEQLRAGHILVAPPDRHLIVENGRVRLDVGPRENGHRPSIDTLFRTAAHAHDGRVLGVILSGMRDDGTAGLALIKEHGGGTLVQSPADAMYPGMPTSALDHVAVDAVVPTGLLGEAIAAIVRGDGVPEFAPPDRVTTGPSDDEGLTIVCPECGGVLTQHSQAGLTQWHCHVGHRYSPGSLVDAQRARVEAALWTSVRALRDRGALLERMASQAESRGGTRSAARFRRQAEDARSQADVVLNALVQAAHGAVATHPDDEESPAEAAGMS